MPTPSLQDLIQAVIQTESNGRSDARGKAGELGLMQIMPDTAARYGVKDPRTLLDPNVNKAVGSRILTDLLKRYKGNVGMALAAYNAGPGAVDEGRVPTSTSDYVRKVMSKLGDVLGSASASMKDSMPAVYHDPRTGKPTAEEIARTTKTLTGVTGATEGVDEVPLLLRQALNEGRLTSDAATALNRAARAGLLGPDHVAEILKMNAPNVAASAPMSPGLFEDQGAGTRAMKLIGQGAGALGLARKVGQQFGDDIKSGLKRAGGALGNAAQGLLEGSAEAAETPTNTLEIPSRSAAPAAVDAAIEAKLKGAAGGESRSPSSAAPSTASVDARIDAKLKGAPATPVSAPKPLPLAVRAADWLPTVGQIGGELGGGALGLESGPGDIAAIGAGGGVGEGLGAEADAGVRALYGLPHKTQAQLAKEAGEAAGISGGGALITPALKLIAPSKLKAAIEASSAYKKAGAAAEDVAGQLRRLLGMDAATALQTTLSPQAKSDLAAAYAGARRAGFDQISKVYQDVLGPYMHRMTPNASARAFNNFSNRYGAQSVTLLEGGVDFTRPTVRMIQQFRSNVAKAIARANVDRDRALIGDLARLRITADADIKAVLPPDRALRFDRINAARADFSSQMPGQKLRAMWNAPSSSKAIEEILKSDPRQIATLLRNIDHLPARDRVKALASLKDATGAWIYRQAASIPTSEGRAAALHAFSKAVHDVPDAAFARLYGVGAKQRMESAVDATLRFHEKMLRYPTLAIAVAAEVKARPMPWIVRHAHYASFAALYPLIRGNPEEAAMALAIGFTPVGLHALLDNPAMQSLYIQALTAKNPKAIADGIRTLLTALAAQEFREPMPEAPASVPDAAGAR